MAEVGRGLAMGPSIHRLLPSRLGFEPPHGLQVEVALAAGGTHVGPDAAHRSSVPKTYRYFLGPDAF